MNAGSYVEEIDRVRWNHKLRITRYKFMHSDDDLRSQDKLHGSILIHPLDALRIIYDGSKLKFSNMDNEKDRKGVCEWLLRTEFENFPKYFCRAFQYQGDVFLDYRLAILFFWELAGEDLTRVLVKKMKLIFEKDEATVGQHLLALHREQLIPSDDFKVDTRGILLR